MKGQWLGVFDGSAKGELIVNIDEVDNHFEGVAYITPSPETGFLSTIAYFNTANKSSRQITQAFVFPIDSRGFQRTWEEIKEHYGQDYKHPQKTEVSLKIIDKKLHINATTDIGYTLTAILSKPAEKDESKIIGNNMSWDDFKNEVSKLVRWVSCRLG
jgi:hypothetical protein